MLKEVNSVIHCNIFHTLYTKIKFTMSVNSKTVKRHNFLPVFILMDRLKKRQWDINRKHKLSIQRNQRHLRSMRPLKKPEMQQPRSKSVASLVPNSARYIEEKVDYDRFEYFFNLKPQIVNNIVAYAKSLTLSYISGNTIEKSLFKAQLNRHFKLTDNVLLERVHCVCCVEEPECSLFNYIDLMCIFLTEKLDMKHKFVFRVYNSRENGLLSKTDLEFFVIPMVEQMQYFEANDDASLKKFYVDLLISLFDKNHDNCVEYEEFHDLVKDNVLMTECLGPCLPTTQDAENFLKILSERNVIETQAYFRFERRLSLRGEPLIPRLRGIQKYYPITLRMKTDEEQYP